MPLQIVRNDITKMDCEAIVNAANSTLLGGGGVDGAIHKAAGNELLEECKTLGGCKTGEAKITKGYNLPAKYVIHTVGPVWQGGNSGERELLYSCYENSLKLAKEKRCSSVAFPLISSGVYGYPMEEAFQVAVEAITSFLIDNDMLVYIVVYGSKAKAVSSKLFSNIAEYIDDNYVEEHTAPNEMSRVYMDVCDYSIPFAYDKSIADLPKDVSCEDDNLEEIIEKMIDESFSQMLLRKIDEKNLTDSQCYKRANVDRRLFSKIRSNPQYKPSKPTALAFAIALELSLEETNELLTKAGYALSHSSKFDIIIEYFIKNKNYNIYEINEALFSFDQMLLG